MTVPAMNEKNKMGIVKTEKLRKTTEIAKGVRLEISTKPSDFKKIN
jgi:hypothetical protein